MALMQYKNVEGYKLAEAVVQYLNTSTAQKQPSLNDMAQAFEISPFVLQRKFMAWAGISPKTYTQILTYNIAREALLDGASVLDATFESGLSAPSRLHDLCLDIEGLTPGQIKKKGEGLTFLYGHCPTPFGIGVFVVYESRLIGLGFADDAENELLRVLNDFKKRYAFATFKESQAAINPFYQMIFNRSLFQSQSNEKEKALKVTLIGTDFQLRVWKALSRVPFGEIQRYKDVAEAVDSPKAARAVGAAVGANPLSFVIPCHRIIGSSGKLTGYHWGLTRKKVMLGFEAAKLIETGA